MIPPALDAGVFDWLPFRARRGGGTEHTALAAKKNPAPRAPRPSPRQLSDWELTHLARAAFWEDKELAPLNLQVSVEQGLATVDGPVPSDFLRRKALALLERLRGIRGVRDNVRVYSPPVPGKQPERHFPAVDRANRERPNVTVVPQAPTLVLPQSRSSQPVEARPVSADETDRPNAWQPLDPQRTWAPAGVRAGLLPPQSAPLNPTKPLEVSLGKPIMDAPSDNSALQRRVEAVLRLDERFREVRVRVEADIVSLEGAVMSRADRSTLLGIVAGMEGVAEVRDELTLAPLGR